MATTPAVSTSGMRAGGDIGDEPAAPGRRRTLTVALIVAASVLMYLKPVFDLGFYYDDWSMISAMSDAPGNGWSARFEACRAIDTGGRAGGCLYHTTVILALGDHPAAYHVWSIALLITCALLLYALLRRCRLGFWPALLVALLFVIYPGSDSTRLWPVGVAAQYVLALYLGALLLGIEGVRRAGGRGRGLAWHAASIGLLVLLLFTYELVAALMAVSALFYLLAVADRRRAAIARGAVDLAIALAFAVFRLLITPVPESGRLAQARTTDELLTRVETILRGAWGSFRPLFLPGTAAVIAISVGSIVWLAAVAHDRGVLHASRRWLLAAVAAACFAVISVLPFVPANDLYVPDSSSLFNRLNLAAAPGYCVLFVALCGLLWTALAHWLPRTVATAMVAVLVIGVASGQVSTERKSQEAWATSWDVQTAALDKLRTLAPRLDPAASVMSFGHPIWERGFIPVFSASWDLRGAIDQTTAIDPPAALPFLAEATCAATGVQLGSTPYLQYRAPSPLWFINLSNGQSRRITSKKSCEAAVATWGRPPFWGRTVTG